MRYAIVLLTLLAACKPEVHAEVHFARGATAVATVDVADPAGKVGAEDVTVYEPYELRDISFRGIPAASLLDAVYGPKWREAQAIALVALDGYTSVLPVSRFLSHKAWFAFARKDRDDFVLDKKVPRVETVSIAPTYLVWDSVKDGVVRADGDYGWPYQLATVKLTTFAEAFPGLAPPEPGTPDIASGFELFTHHCAACHSIDGHGGKVGPELNAPHSVTDYWQPQWLHQWIDNPQSVRKGTPMPGLPANVPQRQKAIDQLILYLKAKAH